jgi:hypothetical protein
MPLPENLVRLAKEELFDGDVTEEEEQDLYVLPFLYLVTNSLSLQENLKEKVQVAGF